MSLNGLDDVKVKEAYDAAAAEPGGWFLLKYVSRDEVDLLGRGNGGIVEVRNAISGYEEPSPLFGFLRYRRRNVIIKYVPEECSRLVQARVSVHFNAITERFSPHDTVFPITTSKELRDTKLSAACSLHTASGSISSSTSSLRRRRLMEIAEDDEEDDRAKRQSIVPEERTPGERALSAANGSAAQLAAFPSPDRPLDAPYLQSSNLPADTLQLPSRHALDPDARPQSPARSMSELRRSYQSERPDMYSYSSYTTNGKPKIKLGPRPSLDVGGRSHSSTSPYRPVSQLPAGLKPFSRSSKSEQHVLLSHQTPQAPDMTISPPPLPLSESNFSPDVPLVRPHTSGGRSTKNSTMLTKPLVSPPNTTPKTPTIKPEKARLLKALELRKKQMKLGSPPDPTTASTTSATDDVNEPPLPEARPLSRSSDENQSRPHDAISLNDSAIAFDATSTLKTDESTNSNSYPASPVGPSEQAESTRASSISGSTDETMQELPAKTDDDVGIQSGPHGNAPGPGTKTSADFDATERDISDTKPIETRPLSRTTSEDDDELISKPAATVGASGTSSIAAPKKLDHLLPIAYEPPTKPYLEKETPDIVVHNTPVAIEQSQAIEKSTDKGLSDLADEIIIDSSPPNVSSLTSSLGDVPSSPVPSVAVDALEIKECNVPRSKFSTQNLRSQDTPSTTKDFASLEKPNSPRELSFLDSDAESLSKEEDQVSLEPIINKKKKHQRFMEPIRTDIELPDRSPADSEANFSSDDDLMDELQSAVFQDAKPISVSKSPISPVFPSPKKGGDDTRISRVVSTPANLEHSNSQLLSPPNAQQDEKPRVVSASAAYLNTISQQSAKPLAKKVNLGSGISQRIKALEKLSSIAPGSTATTGPPAASSPAFFAVQKGSVRGPAKSPSIAERTNSLTLNNPPPSSRDSSPETIKLRERSGSIQSRVDVFKTAPIPLGQLNRPQVESISVIARIVRDPAHPFPAKSEVGKDPVDYTPLDLKQSHLVIDHQKAVAASIKAPANETIRERRASNSSRSETKERRSSITIIKDLINERRTSFTERRRSVTIEPSISSPSIKSPSRPPSAHTTFSHKRPVSLTSRISISSNRDLPSLTSPAPTATPLNLPDGSIVDDKGDKKSNRASRMLRRMSSTLSTSRKAIAHVISPTVREEFEPGNVNGPGSPTSSHPSHLSMPSSIEIGDVNVQFPDTLLWKRRSMLLDTQGNLLLSPALTAHITQKEKSAMGATRRFHLSEFRTPAIPDVEMQELPNSVVLDFLDGGGLQVACEDRAGQARMLSVLQEAHSTWAAYGQ